MERPAFRFVAGIAVSALTSVMLILAFHPYNVWFLAFFALVPMLIAEHLILPVKWSGVASIIGIGGWLLVFLTYMFGSSPMGRVIQGVILVIIIIQFFTIPGLRRFHMKTGYRWFMIHGILDWVGLEMIRSFIPPINTHGFMAQTMYSQPFMLMPMALFSIYGLGIVIMAVNFSLAYGAFRLVDGKWGLETTGFFTGKVVLRNLVAAGSVLVLWIGSAILIQAGEPEDPPTMKVAAVQHNYPHAGHQDSPEAQPERISALALQTRLAAEQGAELIVWPELGVGLDPRESYTEDFRSLAEETGAYLLIGYGVDDPDGWRNEAVLLSPEGTFFETYGKNHPTAPGEPRIVTAGKYPVYEVGQEKIATIICNDVHFTDVSRRLAMNGAQLITVPTLEGPGIALEQVAQSVMRAAENRVAIVKADVAYASAIIDPYGRIVALRNGAPEGEAFALVAEVALGTRTTLYSRIGDIPGWICLAGFILFVAFQGRMVRLSEKR